MSIYATMWTIAIPLDVPDDRHSDPDSYCSYHEEWFEVTAQGVPGHITEDIPWLTPAVRESDQLRSVVFVHAKDGKGGAGYEGQQYQDPLLVLSGERYYELKFSEIIGKLEEAIEARYRAGTLRGNLQEVMG